MWDGAEPKQQQQCDRSEENKEKPGGMRRAGGRCGTEILKVLNLCLLVAHYMYVLHCGNNGGGRLSSSLGLYTSNARRVIPIITQNHCLLLSTSNRVCICSQPRASMAWSECMKPLGAMPACVWAPSRERATYLPAKLIPAPQQHKRIHTCLGEFFDGEDCVSHGVRIGPIGTFRARPGSIHVWDGPDYA